MRGKHWLVIIGILALSACGESWWKVRNCPEEGCTTPEAAMPDTPQQCGNITCEAPLVCGPQQTCVECVAHDDCKSSGLCLLESNTCAVSNDVLYVSDTASPNMECTRELPCRRVVDALSFHPLPKYKYIKVTGVIADDQEILITGHPVSIYGDSNARLERSAGAGPVIHVRGPGVAVVLYDLGITGQSGTGGNDHAIRLERMSGNPSLSLVRVRVFNNENRGLSADGGTLTVSESTFQNNTGGGISISGTGKLVLERSTISRNPGGGLSISNAEFDVTNNVITDNGTGGTSGSLFGGVRIDNVTAQQRFEFNTVSMNQADDGTVPGVICTAAAVGLQLNNNIVYKNGDGTQVVEGATSCTWNYSDIGPTAATFGIFNINMPPLFVNPGMGNFHLQQGSPAEDKAGPTTVDIDIDGDRRPPGGLPDMGADEIR